jgi:hypothetical protein
MANFFAVRISAKRGESGGFDEKSNLLRVRVNSSSKIGLWGGGPLPDALPLFLVAIPEKSDPGGITITEIKSAGEAPELLRDSHNRVFAVAGTKVGRLTLEARVGSTTGPNYVWPAMVNVNAPGSGGGDILELEDARRRGLLIFNNPVDNKIFDDGHVFGGHRVHYAGGLVLLMRTLLGFGQVTVMSMVRPINGGPHGEHQANGDIMCRAVDIAAFRGKQVTLSSKSEAIDVVCDMIASFPRGSFALGFPRPKRPPNDFDPPNDVFFSVPDAATAQQCEDGSIVRDLSQMLEPAQGRVRAAMGMSGANFGPIFPDGLNHLHVKALPGGFVER